MCGIWAEWVVGEKDLQVDNSVEVRRVVKRESESDGKRVWTLWGVSDGVGREGMGPGGGWGVGRGVGLGGQLGGVERGRERERERERERVACVYIFIYTHIHHLCAPHVSKRSKCEAAPKRIETPVHAST